MSSAVGKKTSSHNLNPSDYTGAAFIEPRPLEKHFPRVQGELFTILNKAIVNFLRNK